MFGNSLIRGMFLIFVFPRIISRGRAWFNGSQAPTDEPTRASVGSSSTTTIVAVNEDENGADGQTYINGNGDAPPPSPIAFADVQALEVPQEPLTPAQTLNQPYCDSTTDATEDVAKSAQEDEDEDEDWGIGFDLFFVRWSLVVDSLVTFFAGFSSESWHVYLGTKPCHLGHFRRVACSFQNYNIILFGTCG